MSTTTPLRPHADATTPKGDGPTPLPERPDGLPRGSRFPAPRVEAIRGPRLVAIWVGLAAGAWAVAVGAGYGLYVVVQSVL
ncbi:hypothetical protein [Roseomonas genomospecies 6]|uniref:Uncharacterized protein n=1 Tax=Roseomonas genomospecies 6 TaxID=214106 RepID=A0A9W7NMY9_9PROT|nr:hypothetical protein [Roseomonas genomospecies 6]KAA0683417.1 hypothetical protein DS843_03225 [Roseomonas genomospecies 6]